MPLARGDQGVLAAAAVDLARELAGAAAPAPAPTQVHAALVVPTGVSDLADQMGRLFTDNVSSAVQYMERRGAKDDDGRVPAAGTARHRVDANARR